MRRLPDARQSFLNLEIFKAMHGAYSDEPYSKRGSYGYALYIKHSCALTESLLMVFELSIYIFVVCFATFSLLLYCFHGSFSVTLILFKTAIVHELS